MTAKERHKQAMVEADRAIALRDEGQSEAARIAFSRACDLEEQAAERCRGPVSRAICRSSAAWLAIHANEPRRAITLAEKGLETADMPRFRREFEKIRERALQAMESAK